MLVQPVVHLFFFFNDTATTEIYTLSLHDALPICEGGALLGAEGAAFHPAFPDSRPAGTGAGQRPAGSGSVRESGKAGWRSEEHTSELQSHLNLVCRLLLEKKNTRANLVISRMVMD